MSRPPPTRSTGWGGREMRFAGIGRGWGRGRGEISGGAGSLKKKKKRAIKSLVVKYQFFPFPDCIALTGVDVPTPIQTVRAIAFLTLVVTCMQWGSCVASAGHW